MTHWHGWDGPASFTFTGGGKPKPKNREEQLEQERDALKRENEAMRAEFARIRSSPLHIAIVAVAAAKKTTLSINGSLAEVGTPHGLKLKAGMTVRIRPESQQIVDIVDDAPLVGAVHPVTRVIDEKHVEIDLPGMTRSVIYGGEKPKPGDRVQIDPTGVVVVRNLGQASVAAHSADTGVSWDDIGGLVEAKKQLIEAVEEPFTHADLYARYQKKPTKGILLYGPPGTGKTMLGKAIHTAIAKLHGESAKATGYIYVKAPEILNMFAGNSEGNVRKLFTSARRHHADHHYPCVVFIDEADAILSKRGARAVDGMERTVVPQFLAEMDGLDASGALVVLATNRPDQLDAAVTRDGRIDRKVFVPRPNKDEAVDIFRRCVRGKPLDTLTSESFAELAALELFRRDHLLYTVKCKDGQDIHLTLGSLASGAMCAGIVETATQVAIRRDKESGAQAGIAADDVKAAIALVLEENRRVDHSEDLGLVVEPVKSKVIDIVRARAA